MNYLFLIPAIMIVCFLFALFSEVGVVGDESNDGYNETEDNDCQPSEIL